MAGPRQFFLVADNMHTGHDARQRNSTDPVIKRQVLVGFTDIDGTAVDETVSECQRLSTLVAAKEAFKQLNQETGIQTGVITGRSLGEAMFYHKALEISGPIICEDGAVVFLPNLDLEKLSETTKRTYLCEPVDGGVSIVLSRTSARDIKSFLETYYPYVVSSFSSFEEVKTRLSYPTQEAFDCAVLRKASAYIATPFNENAFFELQQVAAMSGLRAYSPDLPHIQGSDADKGSALRFVCTTPEIVSLFYPNFAEAGICPVVWGNNDNDIRLIAVAESLNGKGVLISHPNGGYFVDEASIPATAIKSTKPFGHGILESLPQVLQWIQESNT